MKEKPQIIDFYPEECDRIKHIKGSLYESYACVSEESIIQPHIFEMVMENAMRHVRSENFFVKSVYCKYRIISLGITIYALELIKLKKPVFHRSISTVNGAIRSWMKP